MHGPERPRFLKFTNTPQKADEVGNFSHLKLLLSLSNGRAVCCHSHTRKWRGAFAPRHPEPLLMELMVQATAASGVITSPSTSRST